jgi:predicted ferric reductase
MTSLLIIANVLGYIGLALLFVQTVFGSRHVFKSFTTDTVLINKLHQYIGQYGILLVFVHPVLEMMVRLESILWIFVPSFVVSSEIFVSFGRFALLLLLLVWITSAIVREKIKWRPWKYIHLLAYPTLLFAFMHVPNLGTFFEEYLWVRVVWAVLLLAFILATVWRLKFWAGAGKAKYKLVEQRLVGEDIVLIRLKSLGDALSSKIGQHFYLQTGKFKSEHPFTIIRNLDGELSFGIRKVGKFWDELLSKKLGESIYVDGPYGVFTREVQNTQPKVIISAGVGFTPFVDLVEKFGDNAIYFNCNRKADEVVEGEMLKSRCAKYVDILEDAQGKASESVVQGRISKEIITNTIGVNYKEFPYFVCGSPNFIKFIKQTLVDLGVPSKHIYFEELGF